METETRPSSQPFLRRWVLATLGGWLLGVIVIVLLGEIGELLLVGDQSSVGIGMGWTVGYLQWRVARNWFSATSQWMWASVVGMGAPFLLSDTIGALWTGAPFLVGRHYLALHLSVALGSLLVGLWQRRILQSHSMRANWWVVACTVGWILAAVVTTLVMVPGHPESSLELWRNFGAIPLGGLVLGVVTGEALLWLLQARQ